MGRTAGERHRNTKLRMGKNKYMNLMTNGEREGEREGEGKPTDLFPVHVHPPDHSDDLQTFREIHRPTQLLQESSQSSTQDLLCILENLWEEGELRMGLGEAPDSLREILGFPVALLPKTHLHELRDLQEFQDLDMTGEKDFIQFRLLPEMTDSRLESRGSILESSEFLRPEGNRESMHGHREVLDPLNILKILRKQRMMLKTQLRELVSEGGVFLGETLRFRSEFPARELKDFLDVELFCGSEVSEWIF